ncbi:MAG: RibD family protein [Luteolibacter sp.]
MTRPRISANFAISADGKITSETRRASDWTSSEDHARLLELRRGKDALIVGMGTLLADRMTMTVPGQEKHPLRCIVSRSGQIPPDHPIFQTSGGDIHLCLTERSAGVHTGPSQQNNLTIHHTSLAGFLEILHRDHTVDHLHCEGGGTLLRALAALDAIDTFHCTLAGHTLFGGKKAPTVTGELGDFLKHSLDFELSHFEPHPDLGECFLSYTRRSR